MTLPPYLTAAVHALSREDLVELKRRVDALVALTPTTSGDGIPTDAQSQQQWIASVILEVLWDGMGSRPPATKALLDEIRRYENALTTFLKRQSQSVIIRRGILRHGIELLVTTLRSWNVPVSATTVARHLDKVPSVLDRHYPDYGAAGRLGFVVAARQPNEYATEAGTGRSNVRQESSRRG